MCHSFPSKEQAPFNFLAAVTVCSDFGAQENKTQYLFRDHMKMCQLGVKYAFLRGGTMLCVRKGPVSANSLRIYFECINSFTHVLYKCIYDHVTCF